MPSKQILRGFAWKKVSQVVFLLSCALTRGFYYQWTASAVYLCLHLSIRCAKWPACGSRVSLWLLDIFFIPSLWRKWVHPPNGKIVPATSIGCLPCWFFGLGSKLLASLWLGGKFRSLRCPSPATWPSCGTVLYLLLNHVDVGHFSWFCSAWELIDMRACRCTHRFFAFK